jgi:hypothetical protein
MPSSAARVPYYWRYLKIIFRRSSLLILYNINCGNRVDGLIFFFLMPTRLLRAANPSSRWPIRVGRVGSPVYRRATIYFVWRARCTYAFPGIMGYTVPSDRRRNGVFFKNRNATTVSLERGRRQYTV